MNTERDPAQFDPHDEQWLTVSQAARVLGVSERQARRYAARLSPNDRQEDPDTAPDMRPDTQADMTAQEAGHMTVSRPAKRPARVRLEAMRAARDVTSKRESAEKEPDITSGHDRQRAGHTPDMRPDTVTQKAGHMTGAVSAQTSEAPADWKQREADFREEVRFLRGLVEQRDRDAGELRAALRKALEIAPRQLPSGQPDNSPETAPGRAPATEPEPEPQTQTNAALKKEPRALWKLVLGIR